MYTRNIYFLVEMAAFLILGTGLGLFIEEKK